MNALLVALVALCAIITTEAIPKNIKEIQELPQENQPILEAEESNPQSRKERCSNCGAGIKLNLNPAAIQALPGAEVHSQSSFEGCSSDKGCAGLKVKDGRVVERFGNVEAFKSAAAADGSNEFSFHAAGPLGVFNGGIPKQGPFWWMTENSPFKNVHAPSGEKYTQSSSSSYSSNSNSGGIDIAANPFLNGDFTKLAAGFANTAAQEVDGFVKPQTSYQSFESSSFSTSNKEVDLSKNPFLNGKFGQSGGQAQFGVAPANAQGFSSSSSSSNKYSGSGYTGSSPSPFRAGGSSINLVQGSQKNSEFDFENQQQQNIDEVFQETGNVHAHEHSGGDLQQTCAGQGYVCVHKAQCNNGVVNTNGGGILQAKTKKQYCNIKTEICCRIEISTLPGAGGLQGSLGVGSATYSGSSSQGSGLFSQSGSNQAGSSQGSSSQGSSSQGSSNQGGSSQGSSSFGSSSFESQSGSAFGSEGSRGSAGNAGSYGNSGNAGTFGAGQNGYGSTQSSFESSSSSFNSRGNSNANGNSGNNNNNGFAATGQGSTAFGATGQGSSSFGQSGNRGSTGAGAGGVTYESSSSSFESSSYGSNGNKFNGVGSNNAGANNAGTNNAGATASGATASGSNGFATGSGSSYNTNTKNFNQNGYNTNNNEVIKTTNTQTNFIETDSFSSGSETAGVYRPGSGPGLKPGVPYLPPVDNVNSGTNVVSSTAFSATYNPTTARPVYTPRPTYLPPSTSAPGYLPPVEGEQTINTETRVPPNPTYDEGQLILDETRQPAPRPKNPVPAAPVDIPSGCAAALKCTPVEFCSADGVISTSPVVLTKDQEAFRVPLTDCKDISSGTTGKCCRDPNYSDPWPTNLIGKWTEGVFGGNDGKYTPDNRGSPNSPARVVTGRPAPAPITGSVVLNNYRTTPRPIAISPNAVPTTPGSFAQKGQVEIKQQSQYSQVGQGQFAQAGQGQFAQGGQGQFAQGGQGQFAQGSQGQFAQGSQGQFAQGGQGQFAQGGQGQLGQGAQGGQSQFSQSSFSQSSFSQKGQGAQGQVGQGQAVSQGQGQFGQGSRGQIEIQEQGSQGQFAQGTRGQGQFVSQGQGQFVSQGAGQGVRQGQGFAVSQSGFSAENEYSESVQRVFLQRYNAGGECGVFNGQKPFGNRNELEVDFAEIPWQAMILLQTNRSLLCGGVITRPDVVITSASCIQGLEAKDLRIKGGEWKLGVDDEPLPFQIVEVKNVLRHPFFKPGQLQYDAAILVLRENLRLAKNIYPICLPGAQESLGAFYNGAGECIVNGWGKQVLQAHLAGAIMHSVNVSLINPGECQAKLQQEYPHLLEQYDQESCACGQPTNPISNICKVDTGSALACTTGDGHFTLRGIYSWDSGCQPGNQLAAFFKFDVEWYEWAIGLIESTRFAQFSSSTSGQRFNQQVNSGIKGSQFASGSKAGQFGVKGSNYQGQRGQFAGQFGQSQFSQFASAGKFAESQGANVNFAAQAPITNSFASSFSEKKVFQSEPQIVTYTTKPEIVTFTTKPEYFTFTTKPKLVTYTTKPQLITYETSGSVTNPQYIAPGVTYNPAFGGVVASQHQHNAQCKCLDGKK